MNYKKHYDLLIERAKTRHLDVYVERHHIVPRCMGGTNEQSNLVDLTPEEHYVSHLLLVKIYKNNAKLVYAAHKMCQGRNTNKLYGWLRKKHAMHVSNHMKKQGNSQLGSFWITNGNQNKKSKKDIPLGWWKGRVQVPNLREKTKLCMTCANCNEDIYWWNKYQESNMSVSDFVKKVYPYNRASFYKLKNRMVL